MPGQLPYRLEPNEVQYAYADPEGNEADVDGVYSVGPDVDDGYMETGVPPDNDANRYSDPEVNRLFSNPARDFSDETNDYARPCRTNARKSPTGAPVPPNRPSLKFIMQGDYYNGIDTNGRPMPQPVYEPVAPVEKPKASCAANSAFIVSLIALALAAASFSAAVENKRTFDMLVRGGHSGGGEEVREAVDRAVAEASSDVQHIQGPPGQPGANGTQRELGAVEASWGVPVGAVQFFVTTTLPDGWLLCDGATYNASVWPELAAALESASNRSEFTVPDMITAGLFPRAAAPADVGTTENSSVASEDLEVAIVDPGHTHTTMFEGNYGTKEAIDIKRYQIVDYPGYLETVLIPGARRRDTSDKIYASKPTLVQTGVSAMVNAGNETRPAAIRLLAAVYAGRRGGLSWP